MPLAESQRDALIKERGEPLLRLEFDVFEGETDIKSAFKALKRHKKGYVKILIPGQNFDVVFFIDKRVKKRL